MIRARRQLIGALSKRCGEHFAPALTGFTFTREQVVSEGKWLAARGTMSGVFEHPYTHSPIGVVQPTGKPVSFELMNIFRYDDAGKLAEEWSNSTTSACSSNSESTSRRKRRHGGHK